MTDHEWAIVLDRWPSDLRDVAQTVMERIDTLLGRERSVCLSQFQALLGRLDRIERRQSRNAERIDDLQIRLDHYEQDRLDEARVEIERLAADMLPKDERDKLIRVLYRLAADVEALKARAAGEAADGNG
jgi:hypothetical protein